MDQQYFVYMLASKRNGTLYTGVTNDLIERVNDHKLGKASAFTRKYNIKMLLYFEPYPTPEEAIHREKCIKKWRRAWKLELVEGFNPRWDDLYPSILAQ